MVEDELPDVLPDAAAPEGVSPPEVPTESVPAPINPPMVLTDGYAAVISIEPEPDNSAAPFAFKPLVDMNIEDVGAGVLQTMDNNAGAFPTGMASLSGAEGMAAPDVLPNTGGERSWSLLAVAVVAAGLLLGTGLTLRLRSRSR